MTLLPFVIVVRFTDKIRNNDIGCVKAAYLDMAIDAPTLEIMKDIKKVFDPNGILNPGKMFI